MTTAYDRSTFFETTALTELTLALTMGNPREASLEAMPRCMASASMTTATGGSGDGSLSGPSAIGPIVAGAPVVHVGAGCLRAEPIARASVHASDASRATCEAR